MPEEPALCFMPSTNRASAYGPGLSSTVSAPAPLRASGTGGRGVRGGVGVGALAWGPAGGRAAGGGGGAQRVHEPGRAGRLTDDRREQLALALDPAEVAA